MPAIEPLQAATRRLVPAAMLALLASASLMVSVPAPAATGKAATKNAAAARATSPAFPLPDPGLAVTPDQAHLSDAQTHLLWPRCVAGTDWSGGRCTGKALRLSQTEAEIFAREYARVSGRHYRLPSVLELRRFAELLRASPQFAEWSAPLFAAGEWVWTSSPILADQPVNPYRYDNVMKARAAAAAPAIAPAVPHGWTASLRTGAARDNANRPGQLPVLLVLSTAKAD